MKLLTAAERRELRGLMSNVYVDTCEIPRLVELAHRALDTIDALEAACSREHNARNNLNNINGVLFHDSVLCETCALLREVGKEST